MSFSALDSTLLGGLTAGPAMARLFADDHRIAAMLRVEAGIARAQGRLGLAPPGLAAALERIDPSTLDLAELGAGTALAGVPVIPFVKALQKCLPADLEPFLHKGATTQDILDTAQALIIGEALRLVARDLTAILTGLSRLADAHRTTPCVARSYGQQAAPISFGFRVAVWLSGIAEAAQSLPRIAEACRMVSYAGPVGTLAALGARGPEVLAAVATDLGLRAPPIAWHTRRGALVEMGCWLAGVIGALAKMATDVVLLAATEVGEVAEPHVPGRGGSSAMPHKRNPVSATVILAASQAAGALAGGLHASLASAQERPAGAWHAEWHLLPQLFGLASGALAEARRLADGLVPHPERMARNLDLTGGLIYADAASSALAPLVGRGAAHDLVESAAGRVRDGVATLRQAILTHPDCPPEVGAEALAPAFDPAPAIAAAAAWVPRVLTQVEETMALLAPYSVPDTR